jgi:hypothetical protein
MRFRLFSRRVGALVAVVLGLAVLGACQPVKQPLPAGQCTQFWRGYVLPGDHNYAGIGAFNGSDRYMCKPTPYQGVRAHMQHLRNYADPNSDPGNLGYPFEPRPKYDEAAYESFPFKGDAPRWIDLNGKWAVPGTGYGQRILEIYNGMRGHSRLGSASTSTPIMTTKPGPTVLTAQQIASFVNKVIADHDLTWKPEISPLAMAQIYLDEGGKALVRGDIAFCQSILETGWFSWPNSPESSTQGYDPVLAGYFELQQVSDRN